MSSKLYRLGILVGRFQTLHLGHEEMIARAVSLCERVGIFVGSSQESGTEKNPFSYEVRESLLKEAFGDSISVEPLPDIGVGNNSRWGDYVLDNVQEKFDRLPDLLVSGKEGRRIDWFDSPRGSGIAELYIPKSIEISATEMRDYLINDEKDLWRRYVNAVHWKRYDELRALMLLAKDHTETKSI